jgi:hypothetical protein
LIAGFIDELINYSIDAKAVSLASAKVLSVMRALSHPEANCLLW